MFPNQNGEPVDHSNARRFMRNAAKRAKLTTMVTPDVLLRTIASQMIDDRVDPVVVADYLGYADTRTTVRYYRKQLRATG